MCCKHSKYNIQTTFFTCTRGQRKSKKNTPKTPQIHSQNHSKINPKPSSNRDTEKALQKVLQIAKKYQKWSKMGSLKRERGTPFFVIFEHWDPSGHPHGPQSFQKRSKEASKRQFGVIFAPIFTHFRPMMPKFSEHFGFDFHMFLHSTKQTNKQTNKQTRHKSRGTEIRAQTSDHTVTKPGTVAGLPAGQLDNCFIIVL